MMDKKQYYKDYYRKNRERLIKKNIENTRKRKANEAKGIPKSTFKIIRIPTIVTFE